MSAVDIALWDLRARRQGAPLWRVLGGFDPRVPCYAGGIDLDFPLDALLRQTDENLARGFRAIKMKVGRPSLHDDVEAGARHAAPPRSGLSADGRRQHALERRRGHPRRARARRAPPGVARGADHPRRRARPRADRARGRAADRRRREPPHALRVSPAHRGRWRDVPGARRDELRRRHRVHEDLSPGGGVQSAGDVARRARRHGASAGGGAQPLVPRSSRLRSRPVHRRAAPDRGRARHRAGSPGPRHRVRLEGARRGPAV